jgi:hypothetical protein
MPSFASIIYGRASTLFAPLNANYDSVPACSVTGVPATADDFEIPSKGTDIGVSAKAVIGL